MTAATGSTAFLGLALGDLEGDGSVEVVVSHENAIQVYDALSGALEWRSPRDFQFLTGFIRLANLDSDPALEIALISGPGRVLIVDRVADTVAEVVSSGAVVLAVRDLDGDGRGDLVIGYQDGFIRHLNASGVVTRTVNVRVWPRALEVADVTGDGVMDYVIGENRGVRIVEGATDTIVWRSGPIGYAPGPDMLTLAEIDGDPGRELVVAVLRGGFQVFDLRPGSAVPALAIADVSVAEGSAGQTTPARFQVSLSAPATMDVGMAWGTLPGTANDWNDFTAAAGTLIIPAGQTSGEILVQVTGDGMYEDPQEFSVVLDQVWGAMVVDGAAVATILNDDAPPTLSISDCTVLEGTTAGSWTPCVFTIRALGLSEHAATVRLSTFDETAGAPSDYQAVSATVLVGPLPTEFSVLVAPDSLVETDETFTVTLSEPVNATLADAVATGTSIDDDASLSGTTEVGHGSALRTTLMIRPRPAAQRNLYSLRQAPYSSYEAVLDGVSSAVGHLFLQRMAADQVTLLQAAAPVGTGSARRLAWENTYPLGLINQLLRVGSPPCDEPCPTEASYRLRVRETTYAIPRFNNGGGQQTVVSLQNVTERRVDGHLYFWNPNGSLLHAMAFYAVPRGAFVLNTASLAPLAGASGSITITHDGGYVAFAGKAVAVDPATGMAFDSPVVPRAH